MLLKWWKGSRVAIITRAVVVKGIYYFISTQIAGARVAVGARRTDRLRELEKQIIKDNGEILIQKLDVTTKSD